jgi:hypothetical protein
MSEMAPDSKWEKPSRELVDKPIDEMSQDEYVAWHLEYMKTVPEENIMMISGVPMEIHDDPEAFYNYVTAFQQLIRQGLR